MRSDQDLVRDFEGCVYPAEAFHHREHVQVAWTFLRRMDYVAAEKRISSSIRRYAERHGAAAKYHHTLTVVWMRLVAAAMRRNPEIDDFERFAAAHPGLFNPHAPEVFYSPQQLRSDAARSGWVEPDLSPLPD